MANGPEIERYYPGESGELSEAILEAIDRYEGTDLTKEDFILYHSIDAEALDHLFRVDSDSNVRVRFDVNDVTVELAEDDGVEICVS